MTNNRATTGKGRVMRKDDKWLLKREAQKIAQKLVDERIKQGDFVKLARKCLEEMKKHDK